MVFMEKTKVDVQFNAHKSARHFYYAHRSQFIAFAVYEWRFVSFYSVDAIALVVYGTMCWMVKMTYSIKHENSNIIIINTNSNSNNKIIIIIVKAGNNNRKIARKYKWFRKCCNLFPEGFLLVFCCCVVLCYCFRCAFHLNCFPSLHHLIKCFFFFFSVCHVIMIFLLDCLHVSAYWWIVWWILCYFYSFISFHSL